jgi:predicted O-methyltransferase YrrM
LPRNRWPRLIPFASQSAYRRKWRRLRAKQLVAAITRGRVLAGPFAGMRYVGQAVGSAWCPKLLGTYELEIHAAIGAAIALSPDVVVNLGAAEGYYAIGLARALPAATIIAYEARESSHALIHRLAARNDVLRQIEVRGCAMPEQLQRDLSTANHPLVVCDVDGGELALLDPDAATALARSAILVELHDVLTGQPIAAEIRRRFAPTHQIIEFASRARTAADLPASVRLPRRLVKIALSERAPDSETWFWMRPRA